MENIGGLGFFRLKHGDKLIQGDAALKKHITFYYRGLFGPPKTSDVTLDSSLNHDIPQVSDKDNSYLTSEFSEQEIRYVIFHMEHNKASGPDVSAFRDRGVPKPTSECAACPSPYGSSAWASAKGGERGGRRRA